MRVSHTFNIQSKHWSAKPGHVEEESMMACIAFASCIHQTAYTTLPPPAHPQKGGADSQRNPNQNQSQRIYAMVVVFLYMEYAKENTKCMKCEAKKDLYASQCKHLDPICITCATVMAKDKTPCPTCLQLVTKVFRVLDSLWSQVFCFLYLLQLQPLH